jgi:hypothetical protein
MTITPISDWVSSAEEIVLTSGRSVKVRLVDVLSILNDDGGIPNVLLPVIKQIMKIEEPKAKTPEEPKARTPEEAKREIEELMNILNKITRAVLVYPPLVDSVDALNRGEGIMLHNLPMEDKVAIMTWAMGGKAALEASKKFLSQPHGNVVPLSAGNIVPKKPKRGRGNTG